MTAHFKAPNHLNAPVVALHSSASSSAQWRDLQAQMAERFNFVAVDLPGYGLDMSRTTTAKGFDRVAKPIIDRIETLGGPVHLVGHSFGGGVALRIALTRPDLVKSLTVFEPAAFHLLKASSPEDREMFEALRAIGQRFAEADAQTGMQTFIDFWNGHGAWDRMPKDRREKMAMLSPNVAADFEDLDTDESQLADLRTLGIPTLVLVGMDSPAVAQRTAKLVAANVPGAELALLPDLGHMAPIVAPEWVNPRIHQHIARVQKAAAHVRWPNARAA
ncbi:MAG: alpha/beta fold hydrolase [Ruegeria sp.]|uniref:alpha/beta fold hydrolase n=1 Tax=Ruegeria sp. TaxID=1879320 RepID=UPI00349E60D1